MINTSSKKNLQEIVLVNKLVGEKEKKKSRPMSPARVLYFPKKLLVSIYDFGGALF